MAISNPNAKRSRRFTNYKRAKIFCNTVDGQLIDLRNAPNRKSDFKVVYTKLSAIKGFNQQGDTNYTESYFK